VRGAASPPDRSATVSGIGAGTFALCCECECSEALELVLVGGVRFVPKGVFPPYG